jgi:hypothetical protein
MAVDSRAKRQSATSVLYITISVVPDGSLANEADRKHVTGIYSGIVTAAVGAALTGIVASSRPRTVPIPRKRLQVKVYSSGTTEVFEPALRFADVLRANGFYDAKGGGIFQDAEVFVPRDNPRGSWVVEDMQRIAIFRQQNMMWEGRIDAISDSGLDGAPGNTLRCVGSWGFEMDGPHAPRIDKPWTITDVSARAWPRIATVSAADLCDIKRTAGTIRFIPKLENWANGQVARVEMSVPTGQTVKRVQFDWTFEEASNAWGCYLTNGAGTEIWSLTDDTPTTGSEDLDTGDTGLPHQTIRFEMRSAASQTSAASDGEYFEVSNLIVATEEGTIDAEAMSIDIIGEHSGLNSSTALIDPDLTYPSLETGGGDPGSIKTFGWILRHIAKYGDSSQNPIQPSLVASTEAGTPDGLPLLKLTTIPALSDYEYKVSISNKIDPYSQVPPVFRRKYIANDGIGVYTLPEGLGFETVTSADDANLQDADKVTADGSRVFMFDAGLGTQADAVNVGRAQLTQNTKPDFYMSGPILVTGLIRNKAGAWADVSLVQPGERIKIDDYIDDRSDQAAAGLILLITGISKTQDGLVASITAGVSDDQSLQLRKAQQELLLPTAAA